jgi:hypothetical protein
MKHHAARTVQFGGSMSRSVYRMHAVRLDAAPDAAESRHSGSATGGGTRDWEP